jgi:hypothetical protein
MSVSNKQRKNKTRSHDANKRRFGRSAKIRKFKKGNYVYLYSRAAKSGPSNKFNFKWSGTFQMTEKLSELNYELRGHHEKKFIVHVHRLKLCQNTVNQKPNPVPKWWSKTKHRGNNSTRVNQQIVISRSALPFYSLVRNNSFDRGSLSASSSTMKK